MDLKWPIFLIKPLYLIDMWGSKNKHNNKGTCFKKNGVVGGSIPVVKSSLYLTGKKLGK